MKFGLLPVHEAVGGIIAHGIRDGDILLKKGAVLHAGQASALIKAGIAHVTVALLDADDVGEDAAAAGIAAEVAGSGVRVDRAFTGRANLFADACGILVIDDAGVDRLNAVDEAVTFATLAPFKVVEPGEMVATVKIIPFAVPSAVAQAARAACGGPLVQVARFEPKRVAVISTLLPGLKASVIDKTLAITGQRLARLGSVVVADRRVPHEAPALEDALAAVGDADLVLIFGASAITDRGDVIPAAIAAAGGRVEHFGMPVDPGNLLLVGELAGRPVLGAPGCARSPKENGFDWVLQRLAAGLPVTRVVIQNLGVGGLLMEIVSRPQPRQPVETRSLAVPGEVAGIVMAAGQSKRFGAENKLLQPVDGRPMVRIVAETALAAGLSPVVVVTGHDADAVRGACHALPVTFAHNPAYADGMAGSLKAGVEALPEAASGAVVLLGDMPRVGAGLVSVLLDRFKAQPEAAAVVPSVAGRRGNPVLLARRLFGQVTQLSGDAGARRLIDQHDEAVLAVETDEAGVLLDVDTPDALARLA